MKHRFLIFSIIMTLAASSFTVSVADLTAGLVGYWPLDGDGTDASGNNLNGTINGNVVPVADRNGNADSAMQFPGISSANISIEDTPKLQFTEAMTLAAWVIVDAGMKGANNGRIISKMAGGGARSWSLNIENATLPATFQISTDGAGILEVGDTDSMPTGEWVHIAGVFRPGESLEIYVNGVLKAENKTGIPDEQFSDNGQPVMIGSRNACADCGWLGAIDELVAYNRELSAAEIVALMNTGPFLAVEPGNKLATAWGAIK